MTLGKLALLVVVFMLSTCMEPPKTTEFPPCANAEDLAAREAFLEKLMNRMEEVLGPDGVRDMRRSHTDHRESRLKVLESLPQLAEDEEYYRGQCEFTDALIRMLELGLSK
ncbi:MAG: hypothetical protein KJN61_04525 [Gammaproteobacteria bacterium]|nr:hypothetical protein [Gammaproteobacteria bacterium]